MKKTLIVSTLLLSLGAFAGQTSSEPQVSFNGVQVGITETCVSADGQTLTTKSPVKLYAQVQRAGKTVSTYVGSETLSTSVEYSAKGECLRKAAKTGVCVSYAPSTTEAYDLDGSFEVSTYKVVAGKARVKTSSETVDYSVSVCN